MVPAGTTEPTFGFRSDWLFGTDYRFTLPRGADTVVFVPALVVALLGLKGMLLAFCTLPTGFLSGAASASGIALINSVGNLGGFLESGASGPVA